LGSTGDSTITFNHEHGPSVNDRDLVGKCSVIEDLTSESTVRRIQDDITVEQWPQAFPFRNACRHHLDFEAVSGSRLSGQPLHVCNLEFAKIPTPCALGSVKVLGLERVVVDNRDVTNPQPRELFDNHTADSARARDAHAQPIQHILAVRPPQPQCAIYGVGLCNLNILSTRECS